MRPRSIRGPLAGRALFVLTLVLGCQLVPPFLFNTYGAGVAIATVAAILVLARFIDGRIVGSATIAVVLASWCVAEQSVQREIRVWDGSSDVEDALVMFAFGAGSLGGIAAAVWIAESAPSLSRLRALAWIQLAALALVLFALISWPLRHFTLTSVPDVITAALGFGISIAFAVLGARALRETEARAHHAVLARHKGDGWIELDDGTPPFHRPELAAAEPGPVIVHGLAKAEAAAGYREGPRKTDGVTVDRGTIEDLRARGRERAAARIAVGAAVVLMGALKLLAVGRFGVGVMLGSAKPSMPRRY